MTEENQETKQQPQVDKGAITRQSVMGGAWAGMKKGMMWGGIGGIALTGMTMFFGISLLKTSVVAGGSLAKGLMFIPVVGKWLAIGNGSDCRERWCWVDVWRRGWTCMASV